MTKEMWLTEFSINRVKYTRQLMPSKFFILLWS